MAKWPMQEGLEGRSWPTWRGGTVWRYLCLPVGIAAIVLALANWHWSYLGAFAAGAGICGFVVGMGTAFAYGENPRLARAEVELASIWGVDFGAFVGGLMGLVMMIQA